MNCRRCGNRGILLPVGFHGSTRNWCLELGRWVELDDGCTWGAEGDPQTLTAVDFDVTIDGHEAVSEKVSYLA